MSADPRQAGVAHKQQAAIERRIQPLTGRVHMSSVAGAIPQIGGFADVLAKERTVAGPQFNRWLVPPAALCIHLCIGMAYGFSVFWLPLTRALGITKSITCPEDMSWISMLFTTTCD